MPQFFENRNQVHPPVVSANLPGERIVPGERLIGRYDYEDGSYIKINVGGDVDTEAALEMIDTLVELKRKELARRKARTEDAIAKPEEGDVGRARLSSVP